MREPVDRLLEDARVVGRRLAPDVDGALRRVLDRAQQPSAARRRGSRRFALPALAVALACLAALPGLAIASRGGSPSPARAASVATSDVGSSLVVQPAVAVTVSPRAHELAAARRGDVALPSARPCDPAALSLETAFDRAVYTTGDPVAVTLVTRNASGAACSVSLNPCLSGITIRSEDGAVAYASGADASWVCSAGTSTAALAPGGIARLTFRWTPPPCLAGAATCAAGALPGTYRVDANLAGSGGDLSSPGRVFWLAALPRHLVVKPGINS